MNWMDKSLRAPARQNKPLDLMVARSQDWEAVNFGAGPGRKQVKAVT